MAGVSVVDQMASNAGASSTGTGGLTHAFTNNAPFMSYQLNWGKQFSLAGDYTVQGVTYGGVAMTQLVNLLTDSNKAGIACFVLADPPIGLNNFVVASTPNTVNALTSMIGGATTYANVRSTTPIIASQTTSVKRESSATSTALATPGNTAPGSIVLWGCGCGDTFNAGAGAVDKTITWRLNVNPNSAAGNAISAYTSGNGSAITATFNHANDWGQVYCIEIAPDRSVRAAARQLFQRGLVTRR